MCKWCVKCGVAPTCANGVQIRLRSCTIRLEPISRQGETQVRDRARDVYSRVGSDLATAVALPRAAYDDVEVFNSEVQHVLKAGWLPVARVSEVASAGDYRCVDLLDVPLVVTRDTAGAVHVLSRVCRHRGMPVIEGVGNRRDFSCPYHLWRYGLDGRLIFAPAMDRSAAFMPAHCNLVSIAHEAWGGWVFANLSGAAEPLTPQLIPLTARLSGVDPTQFVTAATLEFESPWNWKVMVENFLESYHHMGPHATTLQPYNPAFGTYAAAAAGAFTILENPPADAGGSAFVVACVFPLTLIAITEGNVPWGSWYEFDRLEHARFRLRIHLLCTPDQAALPEVVEAICERMRDIHLEDIDVCAGAQRGVSSPSYTPGPLSHLEGCLWRFHQYLQRCFS